MLLRMLRAPRYWRRKWPIAAVSRRILQSEHICNVGCGMATESTMSYVVEVLMKIQKAIAFDRDTSAERCCLNVSLSLFACFPAP